MMRSEEEIRKAIRTCEFTVDCPITTLPDWRYCEQCTAQYVLRWVLGEGDGEDDDHR